jgi:hypothetical protein
MATLVVAPACGSFRRVTHWKLPAAWQSRQSPALPAFPPL